MTITRRTFLRSTAASIPVITCVGQTPARAATGATPPPVAIASANGLRSVTVAMERLRAGVAPVEAVVDGVGVVEGDPDDMSVGYGGLPNEAGVVQLDASAMDGPSHKAGAVAALEGCPHPARVALEVLRGTDHVLLVGAGARKFATACGFQDVDLLTDRARDAWLRWKRNLNRDDDWLDEDQRTGRRPIGAIESEAFCLAHDIPFTYGTIHCAAVDGSGDLGACTTTSGLSYKIPGRTGDSPIVGAGMFVDNAVGAAGSTGRGESVMQSCGAFQIVSHMAGGDDPETACLKTLAWIAAHTKRPALLNDRGEPNFGLRFYALRKDGAHGGAVLRGQGAYAVHDGTGARLAACAALY